MTKASGILLVMLTLATILSGCKRVPGYVIAPGDMAEIMADIHIAETVVENNYNDYASDSVKMLLKQSVLAGHSYTLEQFDTSLVWYGANLPVYNEVYESTVSILEDRLAKAGAELQVEIPTGDSIDIWNQRRFLIIRPTLPSKNIFYDIKDDDEWKEGDIFILRAKFANSSSSNVWTMAAEYQDGSFEHFTSKFSGDGWHEMAFYSDSLKLADRFYGALSFNTQNAVMIVDSIQLVRKPFDRSAYSRRYRQRSYDLSKIITNQPLPVDSARLADETIK